MIAPKGYSRRFSSFHLIVAKGISSALFKWDAMTNVILFSELIFSLILATLYKTTYIQKTHNDIKAPSLFL